jgi:aminoglycoside phosphotransferase (APT) family kinase protein
MHADELDVPEPLVRSLVDTQFPQWADQELERVARWGTDNAMYRLGDDLLVRLPAAS